MRYGTATMAEDFAGLKPALQCGWVNFLRRRRKGASFTDLGFDGAQGSPHK